ncbi:MAG: hypothetical protein U7123_00470 [Potamolinea sp.]
MHLLAYHSGIAPVRFWGIGDWGLVIELIFSASLRPRVYITLPN